MLIFSSLSLSSKSYEWFWMILSDAQESWAVKIKVGLKWRRASLAAAFNAAIQHIGYQYIKRLY